MASILYLLYDIYLQGTLDVNFVILKSLKIIHLNCACTNYNVMSARTWSTSMDSEIIMKENLYAVVRSIFFFSRWRQLSSAVKQEWRSSQHICKFGRLLLHLVYLAFLCMQIRGRVSSSYIIRSTINNDMCKDILSNRILFMNNLPTKFLFVYGTVNVTTPKFHLINIFLMD